jgi:hypothetical protein
LNEAEIRWSLGASLMLYYKGFEVEVHDIDLIVHDDDLKKLRKFLQDYEYTYLEPNEKYATDHFYSVPLNGIDVDIMVGFKVIHEDGVYSYPFHIHKQVNIEGVVINLASIDEWYKAYTFMKRTDKVKLIDTYRKR